MKYIKDSVPDITVVPLDETPILQIKSMQYLDETEDKVILRCAEYVEELKRGFTCNLITEFFISEWDNKNIEKRFDEIKDLVLVYINKSFDIDSRAQYEYVFFK